MKYSTMADIFARAAKAAGLPLGAQDTRHGGAAETAQLNRTEAKMRKFFGSKPGSTMASRHIHLASVDTRNQVLRDAGNEPKEKAEHEGMPVKCPN